MILFMNRLIHVNSRKVENCLMILLCKQICYTHCLQDISVSIESSSYMAGYIKHVTRLWSLLSRFRLQKVVLLEYQVTFYDFTAKQSFIYKQITATSSKYSLILMNNINIKCRFPALRLYFKYN